MSCHDEVFHLLASPDERAKLIRVVPEPCPYTVANFAGDIPLKFHQVWIKIDENDTRPIPDHQEHWANYCTCFDYEYKLWTEEDMEIVEFLLKNHGLWSAFLFMKERREVKSISDIVRFVILHTYGGIYMDCDFPCVVPGRVEDYLPLDRITFICEKYCRNILQNNGVFVGMNFMASPPNHPIITRVLRSLPENIDSCKNQSDWVMTGPMLLNRCVYGIYSVLPYDNPVFGHDKYGNYRDLDHGTFLTF